MVRRKTNITKYARNPEPAVADELNHLANYLQDAEREDSKFKAIDMLFCCGDIVRDVDGLVDRAIEQAEPWMVNELEDLRSRYEEELGVLVVDDLSDKTLDVLAGVFDVDSAVEFMMQLDPARTPTWAHVSYEGFVEQPEWLVHFTDDASSISTYGFRGGVSDVRLLGLTTYIRDKYARGDVGYGFAYPIAQAERYGFGRHGRKYGREAVLFRAPYVLVWHYADDEPQAIFWEPSAFDIVPVYGTRGEWIVGDEEGEDHEFRTLAEVAEWVDEHREEIGLPRASNPRKIKKRKLKNRLMR